VLNVAIGIVMSVQLSVCLTRCGVNWTNMDLRSRSFTKWLYKD